MSRLSRFVGLAALLVVLSSSPDTAIAQLQAGGQLGLNFDGTTFYVGPTVRFDLPVELGENTLKANPEFNWFFADDYFGTSVSLWQFVASALYPLDILESADTYVGAGLVLSHSSYSVDNCIEGTIAGVRVVCDDSDTNPGLVLKGGAVFGSEGGMRPFGEVGFQILDGGTAGVGSSLFVQGGVLFEL